MEQMQNQMLSLNHDVATHASSQPTVAPPTTSSSMSDASDNDDLDSEMEGVSQNVVVKPLASSGQKMQKGAVKLKKQAASEKF